MFEKLIQWLKVPVVEVPDDLAVCEFECPETECRFGDWQCCERRLQGAAVRQDDQRNRPH